ncbi:ATP-binding protein, partial [Paenibacillus sp. P46E]|uniref:HD domain-containing protein n=1 Tax=Paenibacillus sp. P46E TaxID=1349436 RepID=UPI000AAF4076
PEYTPHDNEYHFKNLFNITDDILGKKIIEKLNVNELFILASALYAHDWGMAVSPSEKNIIMGNNTTNTVPENIILLQDETQSFQDFLKDQDYKGKPDEVSDDLWREYVRKTHALRSGVRVNHFFKENSGLAEAVKRACEGHWLNFQDIRNNNIYPRDYSVLFSIVNLRAISIYVRLIDLLDISEDRTPYVLWKFVSPENEFSNNEWLKHRALSSVKSTDYLGTRIIKIDGKTEDHEVYASLQDLKQWCDDQFRDCIDVLAEMNDTNHILDISHIHWNIVTAGFEPSSIKFNFDRERLFEILGEQIYGDDPYVFLRELLQNSVDALKLRQAILAKRGMTLNDGFIKVEVKKVNENELIIVWTDNGVGMNEYIIGNYLSIAGKSFYSSKDFDKIGIKMDVISKFGIGILSCFTLAEKIEITTYREPYIEPNSKLINISIPAYNKYFRISSKTPQLYEDVKPGTTFKIFISSKKNTNQNDNSPRLKSV